MAYKNVSVIQNAKVVLEGGIIFDGVIVVADGKIAAVGKRGVVEIPTGAKVIDAKGAYVGPGFVDIHVHGGGGYSTCFEPEKASAFFLEHGSTTILATPDYHMNADEIFESVKITKASLDKAKTVRGIYMEAPYTNPDYGSHSYMNPWRGPVEPKDFVRIVDEGGDFVKVWTVAPERMSVGLLPFLEYAKKVNPNVVFALGHSESTPAEIRALGKYRPKIMTHTFNATGRRGEVANRGIRSVGPDEYCLCEPDMYAELISDSLGIHVKSELQQMLVRAKGVDKVILITDGTPHNNPNPEKYAHVTDLNFDPRGALSGSKMTMEQACRNVMTHTNCGIAEAFMMAAGNPARAVGLGDELGSIEIGKRADLVFVDDIFNVKEVMLGGEMV